MNPISRKFQANLYELHISLNNKKDELICSPFGNRIFIKTKGWGILWKIYFMIWDFLFGPDFKIKKLKKCILLTQQTFQKEFSNTKNHLKGFQKSLIQLLEDDRSFNIKEFKRYKWNVSQWNTHCKYFIENVKKTSSTSLKLILDRFSLSMTPFTEPMHDKDHTQCILFQKIINIEKSLQRETPFLLLRKLSQNKNIAAQEEDELKEWITYINKNLKKISVRQFHHSLKSLVNFITEKLITKYTERPGVARLEYELTKRGLKIFQEKDRKHLQWRSSLKPGMKLCLNDLDIVLQEEIISKKKGEDLNKIFTIENDPHRLVIIGINEAILGIKASIATHHISKIRSATWHDVDSSGKFALIERLETSLNCIVWKSHLSLHHDDLKEMEPVIKKIKKCIKKNIWFENLSINHLMYDKNKELKSTKPVLKTSFHFPNLIKFLKNFSQKKAIIYKTLMKETELITHPFLSFFDEIAEKTLNEEELDIKDLAAFHRIICPHTIKKAIKFQNKLNSYIQETIKNLSEHYDIRDFLDLSYYLKAKLLLNYREDLSICFLWNSTKKKNTEYVIKTLRLTHKNN